MSSLSCTSTTSSETTVNELKQPLPEKPSFNVPTQRLKDKLAECQQHPITYLREDGTVGVRSISIAAHPMGKDLSWTDRVRYLLYTFNTAPVHVKKLEIRRQYLGAFESDRSISLANALTEHLPFGYSVVPLTYSIIGVFAGNHVLMIIELTQVDYNTFKYELMWTNGDLFHLTFNILYQEGVAPDIKRVINRLVAGRMGDIDSRQQAVTMDDVLDIPAEYQWPRLPTPFDLARQWQGARGRVLFLQGPPGTGKSTYIRRLMESVLWRNVYLAESQDVITSPNFIHYVREVIPDGGFLVIEDGDLLLTPREDGNSLMSGLLNLLSGIASKDIYIIVTVNLENLKNVDHGILRSGRLFRHLHIDALTHEEACTLATHLGHDTALLDPKVVYTAGDIINLPEREHPNVLTPKTNVGFS